MPRSALFFDGAPRPGKRGFKACIFQNGIALCQIQFLMDVFVTAHAADPVCVFGVGFQIGRETGIEIVKAHAGLIERMAAHRELPSLSMIPRVRTSQSLREGGYR